ncbi:PAS domain S-box protein, partial [Halobium palmae]
MDPTVRVLVVDDDAELAELTALYLQRCDESLEAVVETSVAAGLERLDEVDCVVSDYEMPGANGLDFLASVRRVDPDLPFVLFTGKGSEEIASRAISAGVTDYLRKGTGAERYEMLANRLRNAVEHRRTERELERAEARYRRFVEQDLFGCYIIRDGVVEFANEQLATVFGYERSEIVGQPVDRLVHEADRERVRDYLDRRTGGDLDSVQYGFRARRNDGSSVEVEVHGGRIDYGGEPAVLGVLVEVG